MTEKPLTGLCVHAALLLTVVSISFSNTPSFAATSGADSYGFVEPNFFEAMEAFCLENPYDCESNKVVTRFAINTMVKAFYLEVDKHFADLGFTSAVFEYCLHNRSNCHVEGRDVLRSPYLITNTYPKRKNWWESYGASSKLGVYFLRPLNEAVMDRTCSLKTNVHQGRSLSRSAQSKVDRHEVTTISQLIRSSYRGHTLALVRHVPQLMHLGSRITRPADKCWLHKNNSQPLSGGKKVVFLTNTS